MSKYLLIFAVLSLANGESSEEAEERTPVLHLGRGRRDPVVNTKDGALQGVRLVSNRRVFYRFLGIRYGQPPTGERRFRSALPEPPWKGIRSAHRAGNYCPQIPILSGRYTGTEDCLHLNIFTPKPPRGNSSERFPVLVFIHGGAFKGYGGPLSGPEYLIQQNVIVVTLSYRLGPLGFLNLRLEEAPGNAGLKDQILALRWVKRNIDAFGGDLSRITLFGHSAGAASLELLSLSPASEGLFHRAIAQSGSALNPWVIVPNPVEQGFRLGHVLGFRGNATGELVKFLRGKPARQIIDASFKLQPPDTERNAMDMFFTPSIEDEFEGEEAIVVRHPIEVLESGNFRNIPFLTGYVSHEGALVFENTRRDPGVLKKFQRNPIYFIPSDIRIDEDLEFWDALANEIKYVYLGLGKVQGSNRAMSKYATDVYFAYGINSWVKHLVDNGNDQVFAYRFNFDGRMNFFKRFTGYNGPGAVHGDELGYVFTGPNYLYLGLWLNENSPEIIVKNKMVKMWTNFAKFANPTPEPSDLEGQLWDPIQSSDNVTFLEIDRKISMKIDKSQERLAFWDDLYTQYERYL